MWLNIGKLFGTHSRVWKFTDSKNIPTYDIRKGNDRPLGTGVWLSIKSAAEIHNLTMYPFEAASPYRQISLKALRIALCGFDKMPLDFSGNFPDTLLLDHYGSPVAVVDLTVTASQLGPLVKTYDGTQKRRKSSTHRIFAACGCGRSVPVGRLIQHLKFHK